MITNSPAVAFVLIAANVISIISITISIISLRINARARRKLDEILEKRLRTD